MVVGNCTAFHLLDASRLTVEMVAEILAPSSADADKDRVAAIEMREGSLVGASNAL